MSVEIKKQLKISINKDQDNGNLIFEIDLKRVLIIYIE